ncbi:hypothetical protein U9M48_015764 [Paspalum notatum var. saurae]|uniref:Uncharacterized protein n=1 Tax=Paspalum notatum var. saurae TaxID=547442 RepID=A0AAQ3WME1_PASNO
MSLYTALAPVRRNGREQGDAMRPCPTSYETKKWNPVRRAMFVDLVVPKGNRQIQSTLALRKMLAIAWKRGPVLGQSTSTHA